MSADVLKFQAKSLELFLLGADTLAKMVLTVYTRFTHGSWELHRSHNTTEWASACSRFCLSHWNPRVLR